jgi:hypothetical protein
MALDHAYQARRHPLAGRGWHREQLEEALAGMHGDILRRLMAQLKELSSARELVNHIAAQDWSAVDADTKQIVLRQINLAITKTRRVRGSRANQRRIVEQTANRLSDDPRDHHQVSANSGNAAGRISGK